MPMFHRSHVPGICLALVLASIAPGVARAAESSAAARSGEPDIVIYGDDLALVREPLRLSLTKGVNRVELEGVPQRIDSTSVILSGAGLRVRRQGFHFDVWSADRVFRQFLGDSIFYRYGGRRYRGVLAGIDGDDLFIERADSIRVLTMLKRSQINEVEFPRNLRTRPSLEWEIASDKGGAQNATLSYLTSGMEWSAEYAATLDADERGLELLGWATIVNRSGASFDRARVSLVAGEVHRAGEAPDRGPVAEEAPAPASPATSQLFAYHEYPLSDKLRLDHLATVQVPLIGPARVEARRTYRYDGARDGSKVRVQVEFENAKASGLGVPLPEGRVRIYESGAQGARTLIGEDEILHTAAGEHVRLLSGIAFDLVGDRSRIAHNRVSRNVTEDQFQIRLRNQGSKPATVTVSETLYGNWEIIQKSAEFRKRDADSAEFDVAVPPGKESVLTYTVRYTF
jgi:hypothetical protein